MSGKGKHFPRCLKYDRSVNWIRNQLKLASGKRELVTPQKAAIVADSTFFKRSFGICAFRAPLLKKNLCWSQIQSKTIDTYKRGRAFLEHEGFNILAVVLDGRRIIYDNRLKITIYFKRGVYICDIQNITFQHLKRYRLMPKLSAIS